MTFQEGGQHMTTPSQPHDHSSLSGAGYLVVLLTYFEEEIGGEAYFEGLAEHFDEPGARAKLLLLAAVERCAAEAVRPLLVKHGLAPRDETVLRDAGKAYVADHKDLTWPQFVSHMATRYPGYLDDFAGLEAMAPPEDLAELKILTEHEVATIDFANKELAGERDSAGVLQRYLDDHRR
jgi:hypothetical protein